MIGLIQRVTHASVQVEKNNIGQIQSGILLLLGIEKNDNSEKVKQLLKRVATYRIFEDDTGRMNRSLMDVQGDLMIISQFTLPANTQKGTRPSFSPAADPLLGEALYNQFILQAQAMIPHIATGQFGANMQVSLTNDGPVTFWLHV